MVSKHSFDFILNFDSKFFKPRPAGVVAHNNHRGPISSVLHALTVLGTDFACPPHPKNKIKAAAGTVSPAVTLDPVFCCRVPLSVTDAK